MKSGEMLSNMLLIATTAHSGQYDRGGKAYILHCLKVMHYTKSDDEEIQCIAVGHDLLEDTDVTEGCLRDLGISERVIDAIKCLTKNSGESYEDYKKRVFTNRDAMVVKMADLRHNSDIRRLKSVREKDIERMVKYHTFYLEIERKLNND